MNRSQKPFVDVDNYLWLKGMYDRHARGKQVNAELREFFKREPMAEELKRSFADEPAAQQN